MKGYPFAIVREIGRKLINNLKDKSNITLRLWTDQCEYILAQRFRRGQQITTFYYNIWGEHALRELLHGFRRQFQRHIKGILLSSVGLYAFDWDTQRSKCDNMKNYFTEIDFVEFLKNQTLICPKCSKRKVIDEKQEGIDYCTCPPNNNGNETESYKNNEKVNGWEPYLERKNMIIWRKEEKPSLYSYKVYAKYDDITACDFLQVQTDTDYRKKWDDTAVSLEIIDKDPLDIHRNHIVYWEMKWPKLFANRDYVYFRKHLVDKERKLVVICNKSTTHPKCPINPNKQRVQDYWSFMIIKPYKSFHDPGLEFVLTYFDDPGLAVPSSITSWVAQKQMPEFLNKLHNAAKEYSEYKKIHRSKHWRTLRTSVDIVGNSGKNENVDYFSSEKSEHKTQDVEELNDDYDETGNLAQQQPAVEIIGENETIKKRTWWSYLYFNYYFV